MTMVANVDKMVEILSTAKGGTFVSLTTLTSVKMPKRDNPIVGEVTKLTEQNVQVGANYTNAVDNHLEKMGESKDFKSGSLPWGRWYVPNRVIEHKENFYGRFYLTENSNCKVCYFIDGRIATKEESRIIYEMTSRSYYSPKQSAYGLNEHQVKPINYKIADIVSLTYGGVTYERARENAIAIA